MLRFTGIPAFFRSVRQNPGNAGHSQHTEMTRTVSPGTEACRPYPLMRRCSPMAGCTHTPFASHQDICQPFSISLGFLRLLVTDTFSDCGHEFRLVAFHQLQNSGFKLMEHLHACVVANSRTEVAGRAGRLRKRASPVRDIGTVDGSTVGSRTVGGGRSQYPKQVRRV